MHLKEYIEQCHKTAKEKGFWDQERNIAELLMLIVSELGEGLEALRKDNKGYEKKDTFEDEIADTFVRLFDLCGGLGIDIEKQLQWKMNYNKSRERLHGKKF